MGSRIGVLRGYENGVHFAKQKNQIKISKNMFYDFKPKGTKPHYAIFPQTISLIMTRVGKKPA